MRRLQGCLATMLRRLRADRTATAVTELALAAPVLILLYCGAYTISDVAACNRKVTRVARTLTDVTSRYPAVTTADLTNILNNSALVLAPYATAKGSMRISEIQVTGASTGKVIWSQAKNGTALTVGTAVALPTNLAPTEMLPTTSPVKAGAYFLMGEVSYAYTPLFGATIMKAPKLYTKVYMLPRLSDSVPLG
ncbi:TadE/TadG family type IV pilus assembly protein [Novosphingobium cyanobacteriorum]|uniref:Pilus assembly protein n=1 Tax=Novosphingobium cyanobacteriorum TaxID=3024215 RepID=A0ABT6CCV3_9SPHN|nr:TadE/TadG family type IV pilus assembly protein [Novosphingobium cyanobacteriorum]MDF8331766.1 pilus assembly protein [Novosphingobium cyanobacteriorum]